VDPFGVATGAAQDPVRTGPDALRPAPAADAHRPGGHAPPGRVPVREHPARLDRRRGRDDPRLRVRGRGPHGPDPGHRRLPEHDAAHQGEPGNTAGTRGHRGRRTVRPDRRGAAAVLGPQALRQVAVPGHPAIHGLDHHRADRARRREQHPASGGSQPVSPALAVRPRRPPGREGRADPGHAVGEHHVRRPHALGWRGSGSRRRAAGDRTGAGPDRADHGRRRAAAGRPHADRRGVPVPPGGAGDVAGGDPGRHLRDPGGRPGGRPGRAGHGGRRAGLAAGRPAHRRPARPDAGPGSRDRAGGAHLAELAQGHHREDSTAGR